MENKYELTDESIEHNGHKLYRIKALKSFSDVCKGDLGGFVETTKNLEHAGTCWIYNNAKVYDNALIYGSAGIYDKAEVFNNASVGNNATIKGFAKIYGNAHIYNTVCIYNNVQVFDSASISKKALLKDNVKVFGSACVTGECSLFNDVVVYNLATIDGKINISDKVRIGGNIYLVGIFNLRGNACINNMDDYIVFKNWWSSGRYFTWTRSDNKWHAGCFYGTGEELIAKAYKESLVSGDNYSKIVKFVENNLCC